MGGKGCPEGLGGKGAEAGDQVGRSMHRLNRGKRSKLVFLSGGEVNGIPRVAVKCVDIRKNTSGEGGLLDCNRR